MKIAKIIFKEGLRTEIVHLKSGNNVITDAPLDNNGKGEAFSPTDLLCSSLAACMLTIMGIVAANNKLRIDGTQAEITKIMVADPRRVGEIRIEFTLPPNNFSAKEKQVLENAALTCPVAKSLSGELKQTVIFNY